MGDLKINGVTPTDIKLGTSQVAKVYQGTTLVWTIGDGLPFLDEINTGLNYTGAFRINDLTAVNQTISVSVTLTAKSFFDDGVTKIVWEGTDMFNVSDSKTLNGTTGGATQVSFSSIVLTDFTTNDTCTFRCEILSLGTDSLPSPAFIDIDLIIPPL